MLRLKELRLANNLTMREVAAATGVKYTTYVNHEHGYREASFEQLVKYADYYGCTLDYLIGRSDDPLNGFGEQSETVFRGAIYADPPRVSMEAFHLAALYDLASARDKRLVDTILKVYEDQYYGR